MCAAASHTSGAVPTLDRASDVAHCAQNFGQNAKLTISLSNTRGGRRAIAEDGRRATKGQVTGNRRQGQRSQGKRGFPKMLPRAKRDDEMAACSGLSSREEGQPKQNTPRDPFRQPSSTFLLQLIKASSHVLHDEVCVAPVRRPHTTRVLCVTKRVRHHHVGWLQQRKGRASEGSAAPPSQWPPEPATTSARTGSDVPASPPNARVR